MSRTSRAHHEKMSLRSPRTTRERRQQVMLRDLSYELGVNLGNRACHRKLVHAYEDINIAGLGENKYLWRNMNISNFFKQDGEYYYVDSSLVDKTVFKNESKIANVVNLNLINLKLQEDKVLCRIRLSCRYNGQFFVIWSARVHFEQSPDFGFSEYITQYKEAYKELSSSDMGVWVSNHGPRILAVDNDFRFEFKLTGEEDNKSIMYDVGLRNYRLTSYTIEKAKRKADIPISVAIRQI